MSDFTARRRASIFGSLSNWLTAGVLVLGSLMGQTAALGAKGAAGAVFPASPIATPASVPPQFDVTGFIQEATLDTTNAICAPTDPKLAGGTVRVNGLSIVIPCNTILQMPATSVTWAELFSQTAALTPAGASGLALKDAMLRTLPYNSALPSYEIRVQGNLVNGRYIAGLVFIWQQSANLGKGVINFIDYVTGEIHVGGTANVSGANDVRIRLADRLGRFGKTHGKLLSGANVLETRFDNRFAVDSDNPTVHADTGYPLCIPRFNPVTQGDDALCPQSNRPRSPNCASLPAPYPAFTLPLAGQFCRSFVMDPPISPNNACSGPACATDPYQQAPLEVGDSIDYIGTLLVDPLTSIPYISAHTLIGHLGIFTQPGLAPAYVAIDVLGAGTNALPVANLPQETTSRLKIEGFSTDPSSLVDLFAMDVDPVTGVVTDRLLGSANPGLPPVLGRFRYRPNFGAFLPPTRNYRVVSRTLCGYAYSPCFLTPSAPVVANGLVAGQYNAPNFDFVFPETIVPGAPLVPNNFQDLPFLYCGSGPLTTISAGTKPPLVGQLNPAPWAAPMYTPQFAPVLCPNAPVVGAVAMPPPPAAGTIGAPVVTVPAAVSANAGGSVTLTASASDPNLPPLAMAFNWQQTSGTSVTIVPGGQPAGSSVTFTAPRTAGVLTFVLRVTNGAGLTVSKTVTVTVSATLADTVVINNASWSASFQLLRGGLMVVNKGVLTVTAYSSLPATTAGLQLYVQATAASFRVDPLTGSLTPVTVQLAAQPVAMSLVQDPPGTLAAAATCPVNQNPCWSFSTNGVLVDPTAVGSFLAPDTITVTSTSGGRVSTTVITLR